MESGELPQNPPSFSVFIRWVWIGFLLVIRVPAAFDVNGWTALYREIQWWLFLPSLVAIFVTAAIGIGLYKLSPWLMGFGIPRVVAWVSAKEAGREFEANEKTDLAKNFNLIGTEIKYFGIFMCLLLFTAMPDIASTEERIFRRGLVGWQDALLWSFIFGMSHMLVGVPLAAGIALSCMGMYLSVLYLYGGLELSTLAHFQYNLILITLLMVSILVSTFAKKKPQSATTEVPPT